MTGAHPLPRRLKHISQQLTTSNALHASKLCSASEAAELIPNDSRITVSGFVGTGCPEELLNAVRHRFDHSMRPQGLKLITGIVVGDGKGRGLDVLAADGLLTEVVYAWAGTTPSIVQMIHQAKLKAWNLPFGCICQMIRDCGAGRIGPLTTIGSGTFVDPDETGGKKNKQTIDDIVSVVHIEGKRLLWYKAPKKIDIAVLRGTTADLDGNISFEKEALLTDTLLKAIAVHNSGGKVIFQVERVVDRNSIPPRHVHVPGAIVDKIVLCSHPQLHLQTFKSSFYDPSLSGEIRAALVGKGDIELNERKVIAHRAFQEITKPSSIVNLGVGMPEGVAQIAAMYGSSMNLILSTEAGALGGYPRGGLEFGSAQNPAMHFTADTMLDFYNGGGIDIAFLGMAEVDIDGNVNVSDFGNGRMPGCGGFIDISQSAKKIVFMGCLTSVGLKTNVENGELRILHEGREKKFKRRIKEKTFAASSAGQCEVLYITERAVFKLQPMGGLQLIEIATGFQLQDILMNMDFVPPISPFIKIMDPHIFHS